MTYPVRRDDGPTIGGAWAGDGVRGQGVVWPVTGLASAAAVALVTAVAVMMRWPHLWHWPAFTDETREVLLALAVARGERGAWTNVNSYIGPLHVYLTAAVLRLTDASILAPRLLNLTLNLIAVACVGLLAARLGGRTAALVASLLATIAPMWVINNSHVAWSANTTPTYVLAALLCAQMALGRAAPRIGAAPNAAPFPPSLDARRGAWLVAAGVLVGLAAQAHPTGWFTAGGIGLALIWGRGGWRRLRSPWVWLALGAMVATYAPVIIHAAVIAPDRVAAEAAFIGGRRGVGDGLLAVLGRAPQMWWNTLQTSAGIADPAALPGGSGPLVVVTALLVLVLAGWGAVLLVRRGEPLAPLSVLPWLALPALTSQTGEIFVNRYAAPVVGIVAVLIGVALAALGPRRPVLAVGLAGTLAVLPLTTTAAYYQQRTGDYNGVIMTMADQLAPARGCIQVVLDQRLAGQTAPGGGTASRALRMAFGLAGIPHQTARYHAQTLRDVENLTGAGDRGHVVAVVTPPTYEQLPPAIQRRLTPLYTAPADSGVHLTVFTYRAADLPVCAPPAAPPPVVPRTPEPDGD